MDVPVPFTLPGEPDDPPPAEQSPTESPSKEEKAVSAAVAVNCFEEPINPKDYPMLHSKGICLKTDREIKAVLRDIMKLAKKVKSVDLLKVLNYNNLTTSLGRGTLFCKTVRLQEASPTVKMGPSNPGMFTKVQRRVSR
jgi:hypothetical protein